MKIIRFPKIIIDLIRLKKITNLALFYDVGWKRIYESQICYGTLEHNNICFINKNDFLSTGFF